MASIVASLLARGACAPSAIGVIAMYKAQAWRVRSILGSADRVACAEVKVSTVDAFQVRARCYPPPWPLLRCLWGR